MSRVLAHILAAHWAIRPGMLETIVSIAMRTNASPEAVAAQLGRPLANTQKVTMRDGVASLPVTGPIVRYANAFSDVSGATSVEILARDFAAAVADPSVDGIVLEVNSPGGEIAGIHELAAQIAAARGSKPIVAYIGALGCSAAYWLASACDTVVADATAMVGDIGVVQVTRLPDKDAPQTIEIVSSQAPNKRPDMMTDQGRDVVRAQLDAVADVFMADVACNRGVSVDKVASDFGRGGSLVGQAAVAAGMADSIGSYESTVSAVRARAQAARKVSAMKSVKSLLGLSESATDTDVEQAVSRLASVERELLAHTGKSTATEALGAVVGLRASADQYRAAVAEMAQIRADQREAEITQILADADRDGKIKPASRAAFLSVCGADDKGKGADPVKLRNLVAELPRSTNLAPPSRTPPPDDKPSTASSLTAAQRAVAKMLGVTEESYLASLTARANGATPAAGKWT